MPIELLSEFPLGPDYEILKLIGIGSYGKVVLALHVQSGRKVAIKKLSRIFKYASDAKRTTREIKLLRSMSGCLNVASLNDILVLENPKDFDSLFLVMEYVESDLLKLFKSPIFLTELHV